MVEHTKPAKILVEYRTNDNDPTIELMAIRLTPPAHREAMKEIQSYTLHEFRSIDADSIYAIIRGATENDIIDLMDNGWVWNEEVVE